MWVPKSIFITSSYFKTVLSPAFGVKCAAQWFSEQPVGKAIPASSPFASIIFLDVDSSVSQILVQVIPGCIYSCIYFLVCLCASADCLKSLHKDSYSSDLDCPSLSPPNLSPFFYKIEVRGNKKIF